MPKLNIDYEAQIQIYRWPGPDILAGRMLPLVKKKYSSLKKLSILKTDGNRYLIVENTIW